MSYHGQQVSNIVTTAQNFTIPSRAQADIVELRNPQSAVISSVTVGTTSTVLLAADTNRVRFIFHNAGATTVYIRYAASGATTTAYTFPLAADAVYRSDRCEYGGAICAVVGAGTADVRTSIMYL